MIELFTAATPNGRKISILLEELEAPYHFKYIDLKSNEQKEEWFLKLNLNGRIPVIIDHQSNDFVVFESGAILIYLAEKYGEFLPKDKFKRSQVMQWLMFQMSGIGPMQGQTHVFLRYLDEKIPFAINRYQTETLRLYGVLDKQLAKQEYLADEYSIADIATFPWIDIHNWAGIDITPFKHLSAWHERILTRPAVKRGLNVPISYQRPDEVEKEPKVSPVK